MLVVLVSQLRAALPSKPWQENPVIVDQTDISIPLHHHVTVLQVVVGNAQSTEAGGRTSTPLSGDTPDDLRLAELGADQFVQRLSVYPIHFDNGVPIASYVYSALDVLEMHEGLRKNIDQIVA